jgi:hypothetical protein
MERRTGLPLAVAQPNAAPELQKEQWTTRDPDYLAALALGVFKEALDTLTAGDPADSAWASLGVALDVASEVDAFLSRTRPGAQSVPRSKRRDSTRPSRVA